MGFVELIALLFIAIVICITNMRVGKVEEHCGLLKAQNDMLLNMNKEMFRTIESAMHLFHLQGEMTILEPKKKKKIVVPPKRKPPKRKMSESLKKANSERMKKRWEKIREERDSAPQN